MAGEQEADITEFSLESHLRDMQRSLWISSSSDPDADADADADAADEGIQLTLPLMSLCRHCITVLEDDAGADRFRASYAELFTGAYQDLFHWIMERPADEIHDRIWERLFGDWESLESLKNTQVDVMRSISPHDMLRFLAKALVYIFAQAPTRGQAELPPDAVWDNFLCYHLSRITFACLVDPSSPSPPCPQVLDRDALDRLDTVLAVALRRRTNPDNHPEACAASAACAVARSLASHAASRPLDELSPGYAPRLLDVLATALVTEGVRRVAGRRHRQRRTRQDDIDEQDGDRGNRDRDGAIVVAVMARAAHEVLHYQVGIHARRRGGEHDAEGRAAWLARREAALDSLLRLQHRVSPALLADLLAWLGPEAELCLQLDLKGILETKTSGGW